MNGEGFAFFRWHSLMWPESTCCRQIPDYLCVQIWREMLATASENEGRS